MQFSSALLFSLAQIPINTQNTKLSTTQPVIVAQSGQPTPPPPPKSDPLVPVLITIIVILGLVIGFVLVKKPLSSLLISWLRPLSGQSGEEFAVPIKISNVRTQDFFRAEIEGTVYVKIEDEKKANSLQSEEGIITDDSVSAILKDMFDAAMRQAASGMKLLDIHTDRITFGQEVIKVLKEIVGSLGLSVQSVLIGSVDESNTYNPDNYFDAKGIKDRTESIQTAILETRKNELEMKPQIREQELQIELQTRQKELEIKPQIREQELKTKKQIEQKELDIEEKIWEYKLEVEKKMAAKELEFQTAHLENDKTLKRKQINCEIELDQHRIEKENELEKKELNTNKEIEIERAKIEREIQLAKIEEDSQVAEKTKEFQIQQGQDIEEIEKQIEEKRIKKAAAIELAKIEEDTIVAERTKEFQIQQGKDREEIEQAEIKEVMKTITEEINKLQQEKERAKALEDITTAIEMAQVERENKKTEKIKNGRLESEAEIIKTLAEAEEIRYKAVPISDVDSLVKLIRDELIGKDKLKEIQQVVEALAPKSGVLGDSNIYTFANGNGNGEDINKLMRSTSGMQLIHSLIDGKLNLGQILDKKSGDNNGENWENGDNR